MDKICAEKDAATCDYKGVFKALEYEDYPHYSRPNIKENNAVWWLIQTLIYASNDVTNDVRYTWYDLKKNVQCTCASILSKYNYWKD